MVAMASLLACVVAGLVPGAGAFSGFGHPAGATVACVLVPSHALRTSGAVDLMARRLLPASSGPTAAIAALTGLAALLSGFMNNVGALALLMPVALQLAARQSLPAERALHIPSRRKAITAAAVLVASIALAAAGMPPAAVAFAAGVLAWLVLRTVSPRAVYESIGWSVVVVVVVLVLVLVLVLVVTMFLSDVVNNAATAAVMCQIALGTARQLGADPDAFLMAVAIGASCALLTPIGHQNNTLILGPAGLRFGDYRKLGLPLELLVVAVSVPLLLDVWPL
jgi:di/tricarboxylate transporter